MSGIMAELREAGARVKYGVDAGALRKGLKVPAPRRCQHTKFFRDRPLLRQSRPGRVSIFFHFLNYWGRLLT